MWIATEPNGFRRFKIKNAIGIGPLDVGMLLATENQWYYLTTNVFAIFLEIIGADPAVIADLVLAYPSGVYMKIVNVGWSPPDLPPP